jgi:hypothetical protein
MRLFLRRRNPCRLWRWNLIGDYSFIFGHSHLQEIHERAFSVEVGEVEPGLGGPGT